MTKSKKPDKEKDQWNVRLPKDHPETPMVREMMDDTITISGKDRSAIMNELMRRYLPQLRALYIAEKEQQLADLKGKIDPKKRA